MRTNEESVKAAFNLPAHEKAAASTRAMPVAACGNRLTDPRLVGSANESANLTQSEISSRPAGKKEPQPNRPDIDCGDWEPGIPFDAMT
jgi:hypothetical protein